jgi:IrrE N-terminal-like domain
MDQESCSNSSELVTLFAARAAGQGQCPENTLLRLINKMRRRARVGLNEIPLEKFLRMRNVVEVAYQNDLGYDGRVEPLGESYGMGFRIVVNNSGSARRRRFTLAHELCHTFFYEYAHELKFVIHSTDAAEERLCNLGAAELLMPAKRVKKAAIHLPVCLSSLAQLAQQFEVSREAMAVRLNQLKIWKVELMSWVRLTNGSFAISRTVGGSIKDWEWLDTEQLRQAWEDKKPCSGQGALIRFDKRGTRQMQLIRFDLERESDHVAVLTGARVTGSRREPLPLFRDAAGTPKGAEELSAGG